MTYFRFISVVTLLAFAASATAASMDTRGMDIRGVWSGASEGFGTAMQAGAGFSFQYNGLIVGPILSAGWRGGVIDEANNGWIKARWAHESGLVVERDARTWPQFGAVEYRLRFKNAGQKPLSPVSNIQALDLSLAGADFEESCVISSGGGMAEGVLPPNTFALRKHCGVSIPVWRSVELTTVGGRSSNKDLPFFFIHNEARHTGMLAAFGWSGQWTATVSLDTGAGPARVTAKIPDLNIALEPGEEIAGPTVLVAFYGGELSEGSNRLRRLIRDVYTPRLAGVPALPIAVFNPFYNVGVDFDEPLLKRLADGASAIEEEVFVLDAGWYEGTVKVTDNVLSASTFSPGLGNWYDVDQRKLPNGLKSLAGYVRSKGMKFGLWFEPERVARGSRLATEHPDWVLWDHADESETAFNSRVNPDYGLLNYSRPDVQRWVCEMLEHYVRDQGVQYIRYDFNMDPLPYWTVNDPPHRRGITQLRHIQGFYAILDWIRERHPDVILDGVASGGRRIDLETVRRFHTMYISDYTFDPAIIRFHLFGINNFLPGNYHTVLYVRHPLRKDVQPWDFQSDDVGFQTLFGGAFGIGGRVDLWPESLKRQAREYVRTWKRLRHYLVQDFYPLSPQPADMTSWSGWQFHDPKDQSGFIQSFRTRTPDSEHRFITKGLEVAATYRFEDPDSKQSFELSGAAAMTEGINVTQRPMSARTYIYKRISSRNIE